MVQHSNLDHSGLTGVVSSYGSNANSVAAVSAGGASAAASRADHVHVGVTSLTHTSNTISGPITFVAQGSIGITSTGSTISLNAIAGSGGGSGDGNDQSGKQLDYAAFTGNVSPNATTEATANSVVSGAGFTADGTAVWVEFYGPRCRPDAGAANRTMTFVLYLDGASVGMLGDMTYGATERPVLLRVKHTPTAGTRTYSIRAFVNAGTGFIGAGAGGATAFMPGHIAVTKV